MVKQAVALVVCASLAAGGCASRGATRVQSVPAAGANDRAAMSEYVQKLPAGSKVRVERIAGDTVKGTLMTASDTSVVLQRNTRIPEAPVDIPLDQIARVTIDSGSGMGKAVAIGAAVGAAATFGVLLLLAALMSD